MSRIQWIGFVIIVAVVALKVMLLKPEAVHLMVTNAREIHFDEVPLSENDTQRSVLRTAKEVRLDFENNRSVTYPLSYHLIAKTGQPIGKGLFGRIEDKNGTPLKDKEGNVRLSVQPDGNTFFQTEKGYLLLTHLEEAPGAVYQTTLKEHNGTLEAVDTRLVDVAGVGGTIIDCAASKTDYGSHLGGEEDYSMNARYADADSPFYVNCKLDGSLRNESGEFNYFCAYVEGMKQYLHDETIDKRNGYNGETFTPYNYGYIIELHPEDSGRVSVAKHYVTGRYAPELALMMPDHRTLYMSDDGNYKGFWKFVSDKPVTQFTPIWEGELYAAKLIQEGESFRVQWRLLGHASDKEIKALINQKMKLTDILEIAKPEGKRCPEGFRRVNEDNEAECLKLKPGMHKAAAFLESGKYAAYLGATMEFRKAEGLAYDPRRNRLYLSISSVTKSMLDNYKKEESGNDIRLAKNVCGGVYSFSLNSNYSAEAMMPLIMGKPLKEGEPHAEAYRCHPDTIANPDNILYLGGDMLVIGEDTKRHVNNMIWIYDLKRKALTRVASLPIGAEVTGLDKAIVNNRGLLFFNVQHPFSDNPENAEGETPNEDLIYDATDEQKKAQVGYIGGLPADLLR